MEERINLSELKLRNATIADLNLLRYWDTKPHILAANPNDDWEWETELKRSPDWRAQLIAEMNGKPIGFVQIIDPAREDSRYWGDVPDGLRAIDIWIGEEEFLGKGYGTHIMKLAIDRCFAVLDVSAVLVDPLTNNKRSHRFYERLGFHFVERRLFGEDDCHIYRLDRNDWFERNKYEQQL